MEHFQGSKKFQKHFSSDLKFSSKNFNTPVILSAGDFNRYLQLPNHQKLIDISHKYGNDNCFCESRQNSKMINLFFDYDCKDIPQTFPQISNTLKSLKFKLQSLLPDLIIKFYIKQSEEETDYINSMHIITHLETSNGHSIYFDYSNGCSQVKHFVSKLDLQHPFDHKQAYSGHLLRLIHSNKFNKDGTLTNRILGHSVFFSEFDDPLRSLSSYCSNPNFMLLSDYINKHFILQYIKSHDYTKNYLFSHIIQRPNESHLSLTLTEQRTPVCNHKSNNAVCMFFNNSTNHNIIIKCQDEECGQFFQTFFHYDNNTHRCQIVTTGDNSSYSRTIKSQQSSNSTTKSDTIKNDMRNVIQAIVLRINRETNQDSGYILQNIEYIEQNGYSAEGSLPNNQFLNTVITNQNTTFTGKDNFHIYSINNREYKVKFSKDLTKQMQQPQRRYEREELLKMGIVFNQYNYYNCNNTTNNYNNAKEEKDDIIYDDDFDNFEFISDTHKEYFINIINDEFQFVPKLYNLDFPDQFIYVYDENDKGCPMYFDNFDDLRQNQTDGGFWNMQGGLQVAKQKIRDYIVKFFKNIINQFDKKDKYRKVLQLKLKQIRGAIKNNNEFDQYLMETYFNKRIKFNNIPYYLHFKNGTFDLEQRKLIRTNPKMYNTFQIDYEFDDTISYNEIHNTLSQIMQKDEFEWFIKQLSNCLNPSKVIKEKQIVLLIGFGDNGKTVLYNLMNKTLDVKAYAYNGRSLMIQGSNSQASNATPDTAGLLYKRFCYVAELDKNLPFNQQQIKILTGGEEIQTRDLFKQFITFKSNAGIFISSNTCPYIDTQDGGFLNRFKVIDLKYQFVEKPSNKFQKQINRNLQDEIDNNLSWRQGFMNMLIDYYYKERMQIPQNIQNSIDQRINLQQNPINIWAQDNIQYCQNNCVLSDTILQKYVEDTNNKIKLTTFSKQLNDFIQSKPQDFLNVSYKKIDKQKNKNNELIRGMGFTHLELKIIE